MLKPRLVVLLLLLLSVPVGAARAQQAPRGLPPLLQRFEIVEEDDRKLVQVSLRELLDVALERNIALDSVRLGQEIARSRLEAARERLNPTLTNDLSYGRDVSRSTFSTGDPFVTLSGSDVVSFSSALTKTSERGIEYGLTYAEVRSRSHSIIVPDEGDEPVQGANSPWLDSSSLTGSVNIPIGQDYGREFNNLPVRRAEVGLRRSRLTIRQRELDLLEVVASTYWDIVGALERVRVQEEAVRLSERLLEDNRARLEAGVLSPTDVQVTETQLARERQNLLSARLDVLRIEDRVRALLNLEGLGPEYHLRPQDTPRLRQPDLEFQRLREEVFARDPDLNQLREQLAANALDLEEARNQERTDLDFELFYTLNGYASAPLEGTTRFDQTATDAYGAAFTWTVPLFDRVTPETIRQRRLQREQLQLELDSVRSDLSVRLQSVLRQIRLAEEEVQTAQVSMNLAEEQLDNEIERFRLGQSTSFRVAQAQQDFARARVDEILARVRFEQNMLSLRVLTGRIYEAYGLESSVETPGGR